MDTSATARARAWLLPGVALLTIATAVACSSGTSKAGASDQAIEGASAVALQDSYEQVVRTVLPSVVQICVDGSTGSGVVYDSKGDIVTNAHVVGDAKTVDVLPASGVGTVTANVIGKFTPDDLAVIRVTKDADKLKVARFGNSETASIGEIVLAMGNPLGLTDSVTQGIISATGRTVSDGGNAGPLITSAIQTSAAINPGNSGGALVTLQDEVIGIPTLAARLPDAGGAAPGIGFAIPSDTVRSIANQLIDTGKVTNSGRATLGITAQTSANALGEGVGVAIVDVSTGGPADKAGLRSGDIIVGLNGRATPTVAALEADLATMKPGAKVTLHVLRNGSVSTVTATLGSLSS